MLMKKKQCLRSGNQGERRLRREFTKKKKKSYNNSPNLSSHFDQNISELFYPEKILNVLKNQWYSPNYIYTPKYSLYKDYPEDNENS